ncbi:hypothetical protein JCM10207_000793 [Rhodosporidiobolus poonsookiae]
MSTRSTPTRPSPRSPRPAPTVAIPPPRSAPSSSSPSSTPTPATPKHPHTNTYQSFADLGSPSPSPASPPLNATRRTRAAEPDNDRDGSTQPSSRSAKSEVTTMDLVKMTVGIAGAQLAWTVEMAYGTPYLLSLGLTKQGTSLVWMAGPLSGLLVQPVVGALSDSSPSPYRRRLYIALSAVLVVFTTLQVAYARELAALLCTLPGLGGIGDWDPENEARRRTVAIWCGVIGFYGLDFALNGLQASLRALVLDLTPPALQPLSNAWLGRHTHLANIVGYALGHFDLGHSSFPLFRWIGGGQFRKLALVACAAMAACVAVTCLTQEERPGEDRGLGVRDGGWSRLKGVVRSVVENVRDLPTPVRRVCYVQFFNWTAWFPFLFYSTTYISETLYASLPPSSPPPSADDATRLGSLALLLYALVSLAAGALLPALTTLGTSFPSLPRRVGPAGRTVLAALTPRNMWTAGLGMYAAGMVATFWVGRSTARAMAVVAAMGVPWAITCWVPFALVMESIRTLDASPPSSPPSSSPPSPSPSPARARRPQQVRNLGQPFRATTLRQASFTVPGHASMYEPSAPEGAGGQRGEEADERTALLGLLGRRKAAEAPAQGRGKRGGTILGIHNLAIVLPQFFIALVAALIFRLTSSPPSSPAPSLLSALAAPPPNAETRQTNDVVWVLRFGGLFALFGAVASRGLCETGSERAYREWVAEGWRDEEGQEDGGEEDGA